MRPLKKILDEAWGALAPPVNSTKVTASVDAVFTTWGHQPGQEYAATFVALSDEDDTGYWLGFNSVAADSRGFLRVYIPISDLRYYRPVIYEIRMWLRPPRSLVSADPALDSQGNALYAEVLVDANYDG